MEFFNSFLHRRVSAIKSNFQRFIFLKIIAILVAVNLISGCYNFYKVTTQSSAEPGIISPLADMAKTFVIHCGPDVFLMNYVTLINDSLKGNYVGNYTFPYKVNKFPKENSTNRYVVKQGDNRILNEVHLYVRDTLRPAGKKFSFPLKDIYRLDTYNHDSGRTALSWFGGFVVGTFATFLVIILIGILALFIGGSCPYIYVNTGDGYAFAGEIYSGAVYAPLERHDYLTLPQLVAENGNYKLKMTNELKEIQYTNLTELVVIDHSEKSEVLVDKYGDYQMATELKAPLSAVNFSGNDILNSVNEKDSLSYSGILTDNDLPLTDGIIMTFDHPEGIKSAKLFLRAKNSLWLDYVYKKSHDLFGGYYDNWTKKQSKADPGRLRDWSLSQKIPLSVFIEKNGEWVFSDYYNLAGPAALKEDVIKIDLNGIDKGPLKIKLESGTNFWEIDYVGIDYSVNMPVGLTTVKIEKAITNNEEDVTSMLKDDDLKYYVQPENYNLADLTFQVPPLSDSKRTIILHSKGYYQIVSEGKGLPKVKKLKSIREPGQFLEYSRELMKAEIENIGRNQ